MSTLWYLNELDTSKIAFFSARISYKHFLKWETLGVFLFPFCAFSVSGLPTWGFLPGGLMSHSIKKKEELTRILGWLDTDAIKNMLGGLFPCKAWMLIGKIIVESLWCLQIFWKNGVERECEVKLLRTDTPQILDLQWSYTLWHIYKKLIIIILISVIKLTWKNYLYTSKLDHSDKYVWW